MQLPSQQIRYDKVYQRAELLPCFELEVLIFSFCYFAAMKPCQSHPCPNNAFCHENESHFSCVSNEAQNSASLQTSGELQLFYVFCCLFFFLKLIINLSGCDKKNCKRDIGKDTLSVSKATKCVFLRFQIPRNLLKTNAIWDALDASFFIKFTLISFLLHRWVLAERKYNLKDYLYHNIINSCISCVLSYCCNCLRYLPKSKAF